MAPWDDARAIEFDEVNDSFHGLLRISIIKGLLSLEVYRGCESGGVTLVSPRQISVRQSL